MMSDLSFLGAAGTVTGSRYLINHAARKYLVDCGLFQGGRAMKARNWQPFSVPADQLSAVFLTHGHVDHVGYLPKLVAEGFRGPIFATEATCALLELILPDSAYLQEQEARYANKRGYSRHKPALPLYTSKDAARALERLSAAQFHEPLVVDDIEVRWRPSGHILGAGILEMNLSGQSAPKRVVFSGDIGRYDSEIMKPPAAIRTADVLLIESTYGNRRHEEDDIGDVLESILNRVVDRKGVLLIPAFAVGRTQQILYWIRKLQDQRSVPDIPVFIDSPMAVDASHLYCQYGADHNLDQNLLMDERACPLRCKRTHFVRDVAESKLLNTRPGPAVIISASGMCSGGRILHHLKWRLPDARNAVLFVGYQAAGTRGRMLLEGADEIRIHGERIPVRAEIARIDALSAHADQEELLRWLGGFQRAPSQIFITHGEPQASEGLQIAIATRMRWQATIPEENATYRL